MPVSISKIKDLEARMARLGIRKQDISEHFVRSSGKGGQNVNKVSTCVVLKHLSSGIEIKCQKERSQAMNRFFARRLLVEKFEQKILGERSRAGQKKWKIKKQKKRRSRRAKEKMLADKRHHAEKKRMRSIRGLE